MGRSWERQVKRGGAKLPSLGNNYSYQRKTKCINSPSPRHHLLPLSDNLLALVQTNHKEARQMLTIYIYILRERLTVYLATQVCRDFHCRCYFGVWQALEIVGPYHGGHWVRLVGGVEKWENKKWWENGKVEGQKKFYFLSYLFGWE